MRPHWRRCAGNCSTWIAARVVGAGEWRICSATSCRTALTPVLVQAALAIPGVILAEATSPCRRCTRSVGVRVPFEYLGVIDRAKPALEPQAARATVLKQLGGAVGASSVAYQGAFEAFGEDLARAIQQSQNQRLLCTRIRTVLPRHGRSTVQSTVSKSSALRRWRSWSLL
jgi:hypothetical protein